MSMVISLIICIVLSFLCAKPLRRFPWLFYLLAIAISMGAVYFTYHPAPGIVFRSIVFAVQKAHIAFGFFTVVMFIGVFDKDSRVRRYLSPARAELSIVAALLTIGHFSIYLSNYLSYALRIFSLRPSILVSLMISFALLLLLILLTATSFRVVRKKMDPIRWKNLQRLAYVFFGLIYFHLLGYLIVPAFAGSSDALLSLTLYAIVFLAYLVLRVRRALLDKRAHSLAHK